MIFQMLNQFLMTTKMKQSNIIFRQLSDTLVANKLIIDFFRRNIMNLIADIINGLSSMSIVMIVGFIIVVALMTVIAKKV